MDPIALFSELLRLGRAEDFSAIRELPGAGVHSEVVRLADVHRQAVHTYMLKLVQADRKPFLKAIAVYEDTVNGLGSVTLLHGLLPEVADPQHVLLDWILRNTRSYWYYAESARSYEEYLRKQQCRTEQAAVNIRRDQERQAHDRVRISSQSTKKLYNAVRRGDAKAVRALLNLGADPTTNTPEGEPLLSFAIRTNRTEIVAILQSARSPTIDLARTDQP